MKFLELAVEVSRLFAANSPPAEALGRALELVAQNLGAGMGSLALWDDEADGLQFMSALGPANLPRLNAEYRGKRDGSPMLDAYFSRAPVFIEDCFANGPDPRLGTAAESLRVHGVVGVAALPMLVQGECLGAIGFSFPAPRVFLEGDKQIFELVAGYLAVHVKMALASQELQTERGFYERVLEHAPTAIALFDRDLNFRLVNEAWCDLVGLSAAAVLGKNYYDIYPDAPKPLSKAIAALQLKTVIKAEAIGWDAQGGDSERRFDLVFCPVSDTAGEVAGVLLVAHEVTEHVQVLELQRQQLEALTAAEEAKDQFLSVLSHELRTPINAITGFGSLLLEGVPVEPLPEQVPFLRKMLNGSDQLVDVVDDLLDASRIAADRLRLYPCTFVFRPEVERAIERLRPGIDDKGLALQVDIPEDLPLIVADEKRVTQVLANLLSNAVKFTPAGGSVVLRARADGGHLLCEVQDTGVGVTPERLPYLFERFTQADMTTTREFGGLGLGLALVKALVEAHGGQVGAESFPGAGSTFWFTLPVADLVETLPTT